jgi:hypothetical protein
MFTTQSVRVHGITAIAEDSSWTVKRGSLGSRFIPSRGGSSGIIFFAIPTPTRFEGRRLRATDVILEFKRGVLTQIQSVQIREGQHIIGTIENIGVLAANALVKTKLPIVGKPEVFSGICISVNVTFGFPLELSRTWLDMVSVGIDFE